MHIDNIIAAQRTSMLRYWFSRVLLEREYRLFVSISQYVDVWCYVLSAYPFYAFDAEYALSNFETAKHDSQSVNE